MIKLMLRSVLTIFFVNFLILSLYPQKGELSPVSSNRKGLMSTEPEMLLKKRCTICHDLRRVYKKYKKKTSKSDWKAIISRMIKRGARLTDKEAEILLDYLSHEGGYK